MKVVNGLATIFMLHRVFNPEKGKISSNENMKVSPDFLERFILESKNKGYKFISLDELSKILINEINSPGKYLLMTLDDGYKDNYTHAYPLFKKHDVPFTVYLTTSFPDKEAVLWWYVLEDLLTQHAEIIMSDGKVYKCETMEEKNELFLKLREEVLKIPNEKLVTTLQKMFERYSIDWTAKVHELAMTWDQVRAMSLDSLVTIGAHTVNHFPLANLSEDKLTQEIANSRTIIESQIQKKVEHFSYPFGTRSDSNKREFTKVLELKFKTATTTRSGNIFNAHLNHQEALPRVMLTNDFNWKKFQRQSLRRFFRGRVVTA